MTTVSLASATANASTQTIGAIPRPYVISSAMPDRVPEVRVVLVRMARKGPMVQDNDAVA